MSRPLAPCKSLTMCPCNQPSWHKRSRRDPHGPCTSASRNNTHASVRTLQATAIARIALLLHLLVAACPQQQPQCTIQHHKALTARGRTCCGSHCWRRPLHLHHWHWSCCARCSSHQSNVGFRHDWAWRWRRRRIAAQKHRRRGVHNAEKPTMLRHRRAKNRLWGSRRKSEGSALPLLPKTDFC